MGGWIYDEFNEKGINIMNCNLLKPSAKYYIRIIT